MERDNFMTAQEALGQFSRLYFKITVFCLDFGIIDKIPEMTVPKPRPEFLDEE